MVKFKISLLFQYRQDSLRFANLIYNTPWARIGPFIIGLILGYILYAEKAKILACRLTKV
jgi:hypothetical protein